MTESSLKFVSTLRQLHSDENTFLAVRSSIGVSYFVGGYGFIDPRVRALTDEAVRRVISEFSTPSELNAGSAVYMLEKTDAASCDRYFALLEASASEISVPTLTPNPASLRDIVSELETRPLMMLGSHDVRYLRCFIDGFFAAKRDLQLDCGQDSRDIIALERYVTRAHGVAGRWERILHVFAFPEEQIKTFCAMFRAAVSIVGM